MCSVFDFIGEHPLLTIVLVAFIVIGLAASWSDYLDRRFGEPK